MHAMLPLLHPGTACLPLCVLCRLPCVTCVSFYVYAGESDIYLHLRVRDEDSAGALYARAGYRPHRKDWPLLLLLGTEPRYLMRKHMPPGSQLSGRVVSGPVADDGGDSGGGAAEHRPVSYDGTTVQQLTAADAASAASPAA